MALKVAIFGAGWFGRKHAELASSIEGTTVCGFCSPRLEKAREAAARYGAEGYTEVSDFLDASKPDAAVIAVPPFAHGEIEFQLIERGIPFLVEKPLGVEPETVNEINRRVHEAGLITSAGYHFRYTDAAAKAKEWLSSRRIVMSWGRWMGDTPGVYWWKDRRLSGGQLIEQTTHMVDLVRYLCGEATEVSASFAHVTTDPASEEWNVSDAGAATLRLANGSLAVLAHTSALPRGMDIGLDVYTDQGRVSIGFDGVTITEADRVTQQLNRGDPYMREMKAFLHAVRTGDTSQILSDYADARKTFQLTWAAHQAAESKAAQRIGQ
ncbi:Gfo/Idh/MocA family protein [Paenibacillus thermotolerans]|uniref:Gfo/Idh/MocA family protein n=1 Tax=Paenibacillus thermotolerans TaxID=3027807 RepID=UPI002367DC48|nr:MULTISPECIES: Gfo/Idh/MocA family oxidoreductase [unclassified Paenibacillus]